MLCNCSNEKTQSRCIALRALPLTVCVIAFGLMPPVAHAEVTSLKVYLQGGQSNADGRAVMSGLPTNPVNLQLPQDDVSYCYKVEGGPFTLTALQPGPAEFGGGTYFGPEVTLGRKLADMLGTDTQRIAIIKYANGGTNLAVQWKAGGDATTDGDGAEYLVFQQTVTNGLAALAAEFPSAVISIEGMVWMQGENDCTSNYSPLYESNLTDFINDIRATYGSQLPFVIGRLPVGQTGLPSSFYPYLPVVRSAQTNK